MDIVALTFIGLVGIIIATGVQIIPQGHHYTVERLGRYTRTLSPGLHIIVPFIDRIGRKVNSMEQVLDVPPQTVISSDNAQVSTDAVCFYQIQDPVKASYEVNSLSMAMRNLVMTNIRAVLGSMEIDEMLSNRDRINSELLRKVDEATDPWGVKVTRIEIKDIAPPQDLVDAMAMQLKSSRAKRATILEAEGQRESAILVAEGQKIAQILKAEGELEAAKRGAEARERLAEAEAKATEVVSRSIAEGDDRALNYFVAQKYVEALRDVASADNSKIIMMPLEASSLIGSISGIKELLDQSSSTPKG